MAMTISPAPDPQPFADLVRAVVAAAGARQRSTDGEDTDREGGEASGETSSEGGGLPHAIDSPARSSPRSPAHAEGAA